MFDKVIKSARCVSVHQRYICNILYEIADNDCIERILE